MGSLGTLLAGPGGTGSTRPAGSAGLAVPRLLVLRSRLKATGALLLAPRAKDLATAGLARLIASRLRRGLIVVVAGGEAGRLAGRSMSEATIRAAAAGDSLPARGIRRKAGALAELLAGCRRAGLPLSAIGWGHRGTELLFAAALVPGAKRLLLVGSPRSYQGLEFFHPPGRRERIRGVLPGFLRHGDLPDLAPLTGARVDRVERLP